MLLGALQGWPSGLGCWDGWRHGWSAWAVASSGAGAGRRCNAVIFCALPLSSPLPPLSPSPDRRLPGCRRWGWLWCLAGRWLCMGAGVPGSLGWVGLALPCWPCILSASAGCWLCLASSGGWLSPGSCWPLLGVDCLGAAGAGSGSAWASLAPGSPPGCRAGGCPGRAGGGGWAG